MPTYTYDETQTAVVDQIKFYLRQTGTTAAVRDFSDEEIAAAYARATLSTARANVYWTASDMINTLVVKYSSVGSGIDSRQLSKLKITYGGRNEKLTSLIAMRDSYNKLAAKYSRSKPRAARALNISGQR